jgi:spermidine synthase
MAWFDQTPDDQLWPGERFSLQVQTLLHEETSPFQTIKVFDSRAHGKVLVLDGVIQLTERDEAQYHEMLVLPALSVHPDPRQLLIIGAGDGGATREALKCDLVQGIVHVEIDAAVVRVCQTHLPSVARSLQDPRVQLLFMDGAAFLQSAPTTFDVIVVDSSDPFSGPSAGLFTDAFYASCHAKLAPQGLLVFQAEYHLLHLALVVKLATKCKALFPVVRYYCTSVPTYPGGGIGFIMCAKSPQVDLRLAVRAPPLGCKCYNAELHRAAFCLPETSRAALEDL